jgi:hypothetical protein
MQRLIEVVICRDRELNTFQLNMGGAETPTGLTRPEYRTPRGASVDRAFGVVTGLLVLAAMAVVIGSIMAVSHGFGFALSLRPCCSRSWGPKRRSATLLVLACVGCALILAAERRRPEPLWPDATSDHRDLVARAVGGSPCSAPSTR